MSVAETQPVILAGDELEAARQVAEWGVLWVFGHSRGSRASLMGA